MLSIFYTLIHQHRLEIKASFIKGFTNHLHIMHSTFSNKIQLHINHLTISIISSFANFIYIYLISEPHYGFSPYIVLSPSNDLFFAHNYKSVAAPAFKKKIAIVYNASRAENSSMSIRLTANYVCKNIVIMHQKNSWQCGKSANRRSKCMLWITLYIMLICITIRCIFECFLNIELE